MSTNVPSDCGATSGSTRDYDNDPTYHLTSPPNDNATGSTSATDLTAQNLTSACQQLDPPATRTVAYVADQITSRPQYQHVSGEVSIETRRSQHKPLLASVDDALEKR